MEEIDLRYQNTLNSRKNANLSNRSKFSQSRRKPLRMNQSYLPFLLKQIEIIPRSHQQSAT